MRITFLALLIIVSLATLAQKPNINPIFPINGSKDVNVGIFQWTSAGENAVYSLYLSTNSNPELYKQSITVCEEKPIIIELNKTYYWKVVATFPDSTKVSSAVFSFSTLPIELNPEIKYEAFVDLRDYKVYWTTTIGEDTWMVNNLDYKSEGHSWYYDNSEANKVYGLLYDGEFNKNPAINPAPEGWHIPTYDEWQKLFDVAGGIKIAGTALKEKGQNHWLKSNYPATNSIGFSILPAGSRTSEADCSNLKKYTMFWTTTPDTKNVGNFYKVDFGFMRENVNYSTNSTDYSYSIRCVKNK